MEPLIAEVYTATDIQTRCSKLDLEFLESRELQHRVQEAEVHRRLAGVILFESGRHSLPLHSIEWPLFLKRRGTH